jgi:hypothetical protein
MSEKKSYVHHMNTCAYNFHNIFKKFKEIFVQMLCMIYKKIRTRFVLLLLFLWGPSPYTSGNTLPLWLIVPSPVLDFSTFPTSSALPRPLSRESWSCNPVIYKFPTFATSRLSRAPSSQKAELCGARNGQVNLA